MNKDSIKIKIEADTSEVKELINLIRKLKYEIVEIKKLGVSKRILNKLVKTMVRRIRTYGK